MRVVKERLLEVLPGLKIFLDVDIAEMEIGNLETYIDETDTVLVYVTKGYFQSPNCMRELTAAVDKGKPIIALTDPEPSKGLTSAEVREQLAVKLLTLTGELVPALQPPEDDPTARVPPATLHTWKVSVGQEVEKGGPLATLTWRPEAAAGAAAEPAAGATGKRSAAANSAPRLLTVKSPFRGVVRSLRLDAGSEVKLGDELMELDDPAGARMADMLFERESIEWNRIGPLQDVSVRLIASRLLPIGPRRSIGRGRASGADEGGSGREVYVANELAFQLKHLTLPRPRRGKRFHLYVSPHNRGAQAFCHEMNAVLSSETVSLNTSKIYRKPERAARSSSIPHLLSGAANKISTAADTVAHTLGSELLWGSFTSKQHVHKRGQLLFTLSESELSLAEGMLVYLNAATWTSGHTSLKLSAEIARAMAAGVPLVLAHEMIDERELRERASRAAAAASASAEAGAGEDTDAGGKNAGQRKSKRKAAIKMVAHRSVITSTELREPCAFSDFFKKEQTPEALKKAGIYDVTAVALKSGAPRQASRAMIIQKLAAPPPVRQVKHKLVAMLIDAANGFMMKVEAARIAAEQEAASVAAEKAAAEEAAAYIAAEQEASRVAAKEAAAAKAAEAARVAAEKAAAEEAARIAAEQVMKQQHPGRKNRSPGRKNRSPHKQSPPPLSGREVKVTDGARRAPSFKAYLRSGCSSKLLDRASRLTKASSTADDGAARPRPRARAWRSPERGATTLCDGSDDIERAGGERGAARSSSGNSSQASSSCAVPVQRDQSSLFEKHDASREKRVSSEHPGVLNCRRTSGGGAGASRPSSGGGKARATEGERRQRRERGGGGGLPPTGGRPVVV